MRGQRWSCVNNKILHGRLQRINKVVGSLPHLGVSCETDGGGLCGLQLGEELLGPQRVLEDLRQVVVQDHHLVGIVAQKQQHTIIYSVDYSETQRTKIEAVLCCVTNRSVDPHHSTHLGLVGHVLLVVVGVLHALDAPVPATER